MNEKMRIQIENQYHEVIRLTKEGTLKPNFVKRALRDITRSQTSDTTPSWYRSPEQQVEFTKSLYKDDIPKIPDPPFEFKARTSTEVLLLVIPGLLEAKTGRDLLTFHADNF